MITGGNRGVGKSAALNLAKLLQRFGAMLEKAAEECHLRPAKGIIWYRLEQWTPFWSIHAKFFGWQFGQRTRHRNHSQSSQRRVTAVSSGHSGYTRSYPSRAIA